MISFSAVGAENAVDVTAFGQIWVKSG